MNQFEDAEDAPINYNSTEIEHNSRDISFSPILLGAPKPNKLSFVVLCSIIVGIYFIITFFIGNIVFTPMQVEGASMYPTLNKEYVIDSNPYALDVVYLFKKEINLGDVIVFKAKNYDASTANEKGEVYFIKRVIAKGGDTIQFKKSNEDNTSPFSTFALYRNGELLNEDYISSSMIFNTDSEKYKTITEEQLITIPEGCIYVLGDNRNNSKDSRDLGFISESDVVGTVVLHIPYGRTIFYGIYNSIKNDYLF